MCFLKIVNVSSLYFDLYRSVFSRRLTYLCSFFNNSFYFPLTERKESPPDTNEPAMELSSKLNRRGADKGAAE